jgi:cell fate (sporulation/competence/biofilm development) regulator YlbF (YheA/YmcA/DUF963 family)
VLWCCYRHGEIAETLSHMQTTATDSTTQKTRELCQAITEQPNFTDVRNKIEAFMNDEVAKIQYQMLNERGSILQQKQQMGAQITDEEIAQFEAVRDTFMKNPVATAFLDAQQELQKVQNTLTEYVHKTYELGRVPTQEDFDNCGCGTH